MTIVFGYPGLTPLDRKTPANTEPGSPHSETGTGTKLGADEDPGTGRRTPPGTHPPHGAAQREAERSATGTAAV